MTEQEQAERLAEWLAAPPGTDPPEGVDPDALAAIWVLRPDLAPAPRVSFDEVLARVEGGPFAADAPDNVVAFPTSVEGRGARRDAAAAARAALDAAREAAEAAERAERERRRPKRRAWWAAPALSIGLAAAAVLAFVVPRQIRLATPDGSLKAEERAAAESPPAPPAAPATAAPAASPQLGGIPEMAPGVEAPRAGSDTLTDRADRAESRAARENADSEASWVTPPEGAVRGDVASEPAPAPTADAAPAPSPRPSAKASPAAAAPAAVSSPAASPAPPPPPPPEAPVADSEAFEERVSSAKQTTEREKAEVVAEADVGRGRGAGGYGSGAAADGRAAGAPRRPSDNIATQRASTEDEDALDDPSQPLEQLAKETAVTAADAYPADRREVDWSVYPDVAAVFTAAEAASGAQAKAELYLSLAGDRRVPVAQEATVRAAVALLEAGDAAAALRAADRGLARSAANTPARSMLLWARGRCQEALGASAAAADSWAEALRLNRAR